MNTEITSKILDDAREKIASAFHASNLANGGELHEWELCKQSYYLEEASRILALSGTTDIECPGCQPRNLMLETLFGKDTCPKCDNFGVIKHPWKVRVVLENGELPERTWFNDWGGESGQAGYKTAPEDMRDYRQVVE